MPVGIRALAVAGALLGALAGCGGEDEGEQLSATAFRDRANAICRELKAANERTLADADRDDREAMLRATEQVGERTDDALEDLAALAGPDASEALRDRFLARAEEAREAVLARGDAARSGDEAAADRAEAQAARADEALLQAGRDAGWDACTG